MNIQAHYLKYDSRHLFSFFLLHTNMYTHIYINYICLHTHRDVFVCACVRVQSGVGQLLSIVSFSISMHTIAQEKKERKFDDDDDDLYSMASSYVCNSQRIGDRHILRDIGESKSETTNRREESSEISIR